MSLQDLLNSEMDLQSLGALARQGFGWWTDELGALLPASWRSRFSSKPRTILERNPVGGWRAWRDGRQIETLHATRGRGDGVGLALPADLVLVRELVVPRMPAADVRRMLALDLDRLSPLDAALVHFDVEVTGREAGDGRQSVRLGIVPKAAAAEFVQAAVAEGLRPAALGALRRDRSALDFDFLPAVLDETGETAGGRTAAYLWGAVAALLVVNICVLVGRDISDTAGLRRIVQAQAPAVAAALRLRSRVEDEETRRRALVAEGARSDPLGVLNAVTEAVPAAAWVQRLEWNGRTLRVAGYKSPGIDMAAAIRGSGLFANPRALSNPPAPAGSSLQPFDITADARPRSAS